MKRLLLLTFLLCVAVPSLAQTPRDLSVELGVVVDGSTFVISWPSDDRATNYQVHRRAAGTSKWDTLTKTLGKPASSYTDTSLLTGKLYEYRIKKLTGAFPAWGYIYGGIDITHSPMQGTVILVVDDTFATDLATELQRLEVDLLNEGWQVKRTDVKRSWSPVQVKEAIMSIYYADPANTKAVFLFGHVPVPYSGMIVPDGHIDNHLMPWPADGYYGDDGEWTDDVDYDTMLVYLNQGELDTLIIPRANRNFAGDGRFDHDQFPDIIDLMVGRVDLANMPAFAATGSEKELLRKYLDKDHAYRIGQLSAPARALIDDNFGSFSVNESFASSAWRAFPQLVGRDSIHDNASVDWFTTLPQQPYLWAYGCGGGSYVSCGGVGTTTDFATKGSKAIFTMLFGSYFGDWNVPNNLLRAPLATEYGLSCAWSGRPYWYFQPMAIGLPIGFCARLTQNNIGAYVTGPSAASVHVGLMGDPTLKMNVIAPPTNAVATNEGFNRVRLSWTASPDQSIAGYNIYKAHEPQGQYYLSNLTPVSGVSEYVDTIPFSGKNVYRIYAVRNEVTAAGTYLNLSPAARVTIEGIESEVASAQPVGLPVLSAKHTSSGTELTMCLHAAEQVHLALYNYLGEQVKVFEDRMLSNGMYTYQWTQVEREAVAEGIYFAIARVGKESYQVKVLNLGN